MATIERAGTHQRKPELPQDSVYKRLYSSECAITRVRWVCVAFCTLQVFTFYRPYPDGILPLALATILLLATGNLAFYILLRRGLTPQQLHTVAVASLVLDLAVVSSFVFVYTFDAETAIWAVIYLLPLTGAIRFQHRGAMLVTAAATVIYSIREVFGHLEYGNEFLVTSITFRMGTAFLIAFVAGTMASSLLNERRELQRANDELSEVNRAMRDFVSIASHDMRTPLSVIGGLGDHLAKNADHLSEQQQQQMFSAINRNAKSLDRLVNDLLTTSSIEAGTIKYVPSDLDVAFETKEAADVAATEAEPTINAPEGLRVHADPEHFRRIVVNLLTNADKYGKPPYEIRAFADGEFVSLRVIDHGSGVPPEFESRLFERFARAPSQEKATLPGTGLGLAIVKGLAERNGGTVWYERNSPSGSTFCLRLPAAAEDKVG